MNACAGYLVLENFASQDECRKLIHRMEELVDKFDPSTISIFSTSSDVSKRPRCGGGLCVAMLFYDQVVVVVTFQMVVQRASMCTLDDYFWESANNISFFFEGKVSPAQFGIRFFWL